MISNCSLIKVIKCVLKIGHRNIVFTVRLTTVILKTFRENDVDKKSKQVSHSTSYK